MQLTETITIGHELPPVYTPGTYGRALIELKDILVEQVDDDDGLSLSLHGIGIDLITMPITEDVMQRAAEKIDELRYELLGDPFDSSEKPRLCEEPLFDGEWIWSKLKYDAYVKLSNLSPFTGQPLVAKPHILAQKICLWINKFLPTVSQAAPQVPQPESKEIALINKMQALTFRNPDLARVAEAAVLNAWHANARTAIIRRTNQQQRKVIKEITREAKEGIARTRELLKKEAELLREERVEHEEKLKESIATADRAHQAVAATLHARVDEGDKKLQKTEKRLEDAETEVLSLHQRNSQLARDIYQKEQQLHRMQEDRGGGCTIL